MKHGFLKVAAGTPQIRVADCRFNAEQIFTLMREAAEQGVRVLCLPELCLTGYSCGDLFLHGTLIRGAEEALSTVLEATRNLDMITVLGLPVLHQNQLYSCAAVIQKGKILGLVPKMHPARSGSTPETRWFAPAPDSAVTVTLAGQQVCLSARQLFVCTTMPQLILGVELDTDDWTALPTGTDLAVQGATLILHPAASTAQAGKAASRYQMAEELSTRLVCGYVYASAGDGESTTDVVYSGHDMIAENGVILAQRCFATGLTISELDLEQLAFERRRRPFHTASQTCDFLFQSFALEPGTTTLTRTISPFPFIPVGHEAQLNQCDEILRIAALGLKKRLEHTGAKTAVIGLSGGLDSTLAILITMIAMSMLGRPTTDVIAVTMPCFGTTDRTRDNAVELATRLGCTLKRIDIGESVRRHFHDIGQSMEDHDVTFENAQARERTQVLMDIANQLGGLVIGTGDLSELALGWATYNGDHMSMYAVNASIPKTLVRHLVSFVCSDKEKEDQELSDVLADILDTPVSPELLPAINGQIAQKTEDLVGPYELHDFYLYYVLRWGFSPSKVLRLAEHAFGRTYDRATLLQWLRNFYRRFFAQQFKRSCLPDGPQVGELSLSPRGSWFMPSDAVAALWLEELEGLD